MFTNNVLLFKIGTTETKEDFFFARTDVLLVDTLI